ncbi:MAG: hypothetical protein HPZ91_08710 [Lentisphaeria bacterium]|nr:hypothetical protein [Lentisphaeria bacterium]
MIDLHSHILPGIDDGAADFEAACRMLAAAKRDGVMMLAATSHASAPAADYDAAFARLEPEAAKFGITLLRGLEYDYCRLEPELPFVTLGATRFILLDFAQPSLPPGAEAMLFTLAQRGFRPVVVHPERLFATDPLRTLEPIAGLDPVFQLNSGSILGRYGKKVRESALRLIDGGCCHFFANDAHNENGFRLTECRALLSKRYPPETVTLWFEENPARILAGEEPLPVRPPRPGVLGKLRARLGL